MNEILPLCQLHAKFFQCLESFPVYSVQGETECLRFQDVLSQMLIEKLLLAEVLIQLELFILEDSL